MGLIGQAIAIDPRYGPALSWAAVCHLRLISDGWTGQEPDTNRRKGADLARRALQVGENGPGVLVNEDNPGSPTPYRVLAACYAHMGRLDEARLTVAKVRALTHLVMPTNLPYRNTEDCELLLSGLRLATDDSK